MDKNRCLEKANEILSKMTLKEKIGQVTQMYYSGENFDEISRIIEEVNPGSLILAGSALAGNEDQVAVNREKIDKLQETAINHTKNKIPILFGRDVIHGHSVVFPNPLNMACSFDFDLVQKCYDAIRAEAINAGVKWTFAPMIDLARDPRWGRIVEGTGEDPYIGECYAKAAVNGFQTDDLSNENSMAACAKHFVGYGASEGGRDYNHTEISDYLMQNVYLSSFRGAIDADVATVMSSFNDLNGIPMSGNKHMLTDVLRNQLGFDGFVVSDWDAIRQMMAFSFFAEDKKLKTDQLLLTSPLPVSKLVIGKFIGAYLVFWTCTLINIVYIIIIDIFGIIDYGSLFTNFIGTVLLSGTMISIALFLSSLTENTIIAAASSLAVLFGFMVIDFFAAFIPAEWLQNTLKSLTVYSYYDDFTNGILNLVPVVFYISVTAVMLFLTMRMIERRRWN